MTLTTTPPSGKVVRHRTIGPMLGGGFTLDSTELLLRARKQSAQASAQMRMVPVQSRQRALRRALAAVTRDSKSSSKG